MSVNPSLFANNVGAFALQVLRLKDMVWVPNLCGWANPRLIGGVDGLTVDDTIFQKAQDCIQDPAKLKCLQLIYGETRMCL